jgi:hypothetical protein
VRGLGALISTVSAVPSCEMNDACTARKAGALITGGTSLPLALTMKVAGTRAFVDPPLGFELVLTPAPPLPLLAPVGVVEGCVAEGCVAELVVDELAAGWVVVAGAVVAVPAVVVVAATVVWAPVVTGFAATLELECLEEPPQPLTPLTPTATTATTATGRSPERLNLPRRAVDICD